MFKPISREEYHKIKWEWMYSKDNCPFCDKERYEKQCYRQWKYWQLLFCLSSYSWDYRHLMAVPFEHIVYSNDLKEKHFKELKEIHKIVKDFFKDEEYFSFTRESISDETRSVEHLHMHFLVWKLQWKFLRKMLELQWYPIKQQLDIN